MNKQLRIKLFKDAAIFWIIKFSTCYQQGDNKEICQYFKQILNYLITSNQFQQLAIQRFKVNRGGFGSIHYGIYKNEEVAIKEIKFRQDQNNDVFISLLREIAIMAYCEHPNIAKIKAVYFHPNKIKDKYHVSIIQPRYFQDLHSVLFKGKSPIINKKMICYQILKALQYIHDIGLVHLDLKPSNFMFCDDTLSEIVILDFGISDIQRENQSHKVQGITPAYCPPEIRFNDLSQISPKADSFSFGIILYELITERRAWAKYQHPSQIYNAIHKQNFSFFSKNKETGINEMDQLIQKCTSIDVAQRPSARETLEIIKDFDFEF